VGVLILSGSFSLREIVTHRLGLLALIPPLEYFPQLIGVFIYLMAAYAKPTASLFDLPEAETELVAGNHTEYSAMKFCHVFHGGIRQHDHRWHVWHMLFFGGGMARYLPVILQAHAPVFCFAPRFRVYFYLYMGARHMPRFRLYS